MPADTWNDPKVDRQRGREMKNLYNGAKKHRAAVNRALGIEPEEKKTSIYTHLASGAFNAAIVALAITASGIFNDVSGAKADRSFMAQNSYDSAVKHHKPRQ